MALEQTLNAPMITTIATTMMAMRLKGIERRFCLTEPSFETDVRCERRDDVLPRLRDVEVSVEATGRELRDVPNDCELRELREDSVDADDRSLRDDEAR